MDMSNKSLALLLVAAIVISLGGTLISLNKLGQVGVATPKISGMVSGKVNLSIASTPGCAVDGNVSFGPGNQPSAQVILSSHNKSNDQEGFSHNCVYGGDTDCGVVVNNTGNVDVQLNFTLNKNESDLHLGANSGSGYFMYLARNGTDDASPEQPGCRGGGTLASTWTDVPVANTPHTICSNFTFDDAYDIVTVEYNITVDPDAEPGEKLTTITVTCTQLP